MARGLANLLPTRSENAKEPRKNALFRFGGKNAVASLWTKKTKKFVKISQLRKLSLESQKKERKK